MSGHAWFFLCIRALMCFFMCVFTMHSPTCCNCAFLDVYICAYDVYVCVCVYSCVHMGTDVFFFMCVVHSQPHFAMRGFDPVYSPYVLVCTYGYWCIFFYVCCAFTAPLATTGPFFYMYICRYVRLCVYLCMCVLTCIHVCVCVCVLRVPPHLLLLAPSVMCIYVCVCTPPQNLFGCGVSTPCTLFCLIFTIRSELNYFQIFTDLSEPGSISDGFQ